MTYEQAVDLLAWVNRPELAGYPWKDYQQVLIAEAVEIRGWAVA